MTVTNERTTSTPAAPELVTLTIDGFEISVPKGTLVIRAAEMLGIQIPRFCEHPLLDPVGACRQCLVEVEGQRKPLASCTTTVTEGMVVRTQYTSPVAEKAQNGIIELLLINHPLDCPVCDKGGECPLQNQAMTNGYAESRFHDVKRTYPKPIAISAQVLLDRERCVLCTRCTRFAQQIAGDPFIEMFERSALEQVAVYEDQPFQSYFSGNTIQICPVGALTGTQYRFRARPFDLVSTPSICEHCASGCAQRNDHRRGKMLRRLAGSDADVNEEWNCDKGRWGYTYAFLSDRLETPLVRGSDGNLVPASWPEALQAAARGLAAARGRAGVLVGGRVSTEDAYGYGKFARVALETNDVDFRARPHSAEEAEFLAAVIAGRYLDVTYADLERAPAVLLAGFEAEEESPIVFLRLRKAALKRGTRVFSIAPLATHGLVKMSGRLLGCIPGGETGLLTALRDGVPPAPPSGVPPADFAADFAAAAELLRQPGSVVIVGERLAAVPGALTAAAALADTTGARIAWIPRRAGERGALEAGALPNLLPSGRRLSDPDEATPVALRWASSLPTRPGRDTAGMLRAALDGELTAFVVGGVDLDDLPDPEAAHAALQAAAFVVSLEQRRSTATEYADVVFPVATAMEKSGTFLNWEGRSRPFEASFPEVGALSDYQVLNAIADAMDVHLGLPDLATVRAELAALAVDRTPGRAQVGSSYAAAEPARPGPGEAILATWHELLDRGRLMDGNPYLAATAKPVRAQLSPATAARLGVRSGRPITVSTARGSITVPAYVTPMVDDVVWLPTRSAEYQVYRSLGVPAGAVGAVRPADEGAQPGERG
ncbi:MAG: NADH-quinone oxidoreductase subunit G [Acidothermus cellulolyticus]|nr:NADH-quinone oxidoreductase subunit G [Acidothermus cellulolyticus]